MAQSSWPDPATSRAVSDTQYERLVATQHVDGLVGSPSDAPLVSADGTGLHVTVAASRYAQLRGHGWTSGSTPLSPSIGGNGSGSTRTDLVVLGLDRSTWAVTVYVKAGTPGAGAPALQVDTGSTGIYEIPLAEVTVLVGVSSITADKVKVRHWYVRPDGTASAGADTRPVNMPVGVMTTEGGDKLAWTGSAWINLTSPPTVVGNAMGAPLLGSGDLTDDAGWHDVPSGNWAPLTFTVPPSGRIVVTVSGWIENHLNSGSTIWLSYRAVGTGGMFPGTTTEEINYRGISVRSGRLVASKSRLFAGLVPGGSVTLTPVYLTSTASADANISSIRDGVLIVDPK